MNAQNPFVAWALESLAPLETVALGKMIGDASLVALGEGVHGAAEPLEFRNRLFQYLVIEQGFTAIAIESGAAKARLVHQYVRGEAGELSNVMAQGVTWTFDRLPQNRELVQWLRQYNDDPRHSRKVNFYGFDVLSNGSAGDETGHLLEMEDLRDRAQADNIEQIVKEEGAAGKILLFAHRYHLSATPLTRIYMSPRGLAEHVHQMAGSYLRHRFGRKLVTIGNLIGQGEVRCGDDHEMLAPAPLDSVDGIARAVGVPSFLLDLRNAPAPVMEWLKQERVHVRPHYTFKLSLGGAFDILYYLDKVTPACAS